MFKRVFENIFKADSLNIILPILFVQLVLSVGTYKILKPHLHKKPCAVCGRANTAVKKSLWEFKPGVLKHVKIFYCKHHFEKAPKIVQKIPSENDSTVKRYWQITVAGYLLYISIVYSLALFNLSMVYSISVPLIQLILFYFKGIVSSFSILFLFSSFLIAPVFFFYLWVNIESGKIKLR
ncbi:MAG: hypothetical protein JXQ65_10315 [Candidatus Marinimicrobia bacterium]|nr:hypothetical protein [Candidatus Neomarinimicrobiota bacterium]